MNSKKKEPILKFLDKLVKLLNFLPSEFSHHLSLTGLKVIEKIGLIKKKNLTKEASTSGKISILGFSLSNRVGLAAGLDKNGDYMDSLASLGFSFLEIGTVTPRAQRGNPKPRLFRLNTKRSLLNSMGFNNKGVDHVISQLKKRKTDAVIGVSVGKNWDTPLEKAVEDYLYCFKKTYPYADYLAINISSPNTRDLRKLEEINHFKELLIALKSEQDKLKRNFGYKPIVLKLSPDIEFDRQKEISEEILDKEIDGIVCSNTSANHSFSNSGGLSGQELFELSTEKLSSYRGLLGSSFPIIASGGVMDKSSFKKKIDAGANLVQVYTGMIFEGPGLISELIDL